MTPIPVTTAALAPGDDIIEVAGTALAATGLTPRPTDILAVREGPLAISQGRIVSVAALNPSLTARVFSRLYGTDGRLGTAHGMQAAIDVAGPARTALGLAAGLAGRLIGRQGDFFSRVAGRQVAGIDNVSTARRSYSPEIVLGPDDPRGVAARIAEAMGCGAAVVGTNHLGRVEIMGASAFLDRDRLTEAMGSGPGGDADEEAPLVLVRA